MSTSKDALTPIFKPSPVVLERTVREPPFTDTSHPSTHPSKKNSRPRKKQGVDVKLKPLEGNKSLMRKGKADGSLRKRVKEETSSGEEGVRVVKGVKRPDVFIKPVKKVRKKINTFKTWTGVTEVNSSSEKGGERVKGVKRSDIFIKPTKKARKKMNPFKTWRV